GLGEREAHGLDADGRVGRDRDELVREPRVRGVRRQILADAFLLDLRRVGEDGVERAEPLDERARRLVADARDAREVVRRVAHEGEQVADPRRRDAELLLDLFRTEDRRAVGARHMPRREGIPDLDAIGDELREILVARYDLDLATLLFAFASQRADDVV